jgi:O-acetylhomoserine/O-acetylserine sulfhydrylase-like pyridoxal-dependent enzyme
LTQKLSIPGDEIGSSGRLCGGTFTQFDVSLRILDVQVHFVDPDIPSDPSPAYHGLNF